MVTEVRVPKEPVELKFDPMGSDEKTRAVFEDDIARTLYLMIRPHHVVDISFTDWCLNRAKEIGDYLKSAKGQIDQERIHDIIRPKFYNPTEMVFLSRDWQESTPWLERFIEAISGLKPIKYQRV